VNAVAPGPTDTGMLSRFTGTAETRLPGEAGSARSSRPLRGGRRRHVFIALDGAKWITSEILNVDGGMTRIDTDRTSMTQHNHQTAPTQFVEADGIRFAYRRFGNAAGVPLVFNQHFTGTMDHWDPAVTDGFADREVILFNNAGVSSSPAKCPPGSRKWRQRGGVHQGAGTGESRCARLFDRRLCRAGKSPFRRPTS